MYIYLDEAGSFSGFQPGSISAVGALAIPDSKIEFIKTKYAKIRRHLPVKKGEVKGRSLDERQVNEVAALLARNEAVFEITVIDLGVQTEAEVIAYKKAHAQEMLARVHRFHESVRQSVESSARQILVTSVPLYLQAIATFDLLHTVIYHIPLFLLNEGRKIWEPSHGSSMVKIDPK